MKNSTIAIIIGILVVVSFATGFVTRYATEKPTPETKTVFVYEKDKKIAFRVDSLLKMKAIYLKNIDSLKNCLTQKSKTHENIVITVDTMPLPDVFRELSSYYVR